MQQGGLIVRTSLNPVLQAAADNAVRDGLEQYDHTYDGWHGLVAHVDDPDIATNWQPDLAKQANPPGMRQDWHLAIVIKAADRSAKSATSIPPPIAASRPPAGSPRYHPLGPPGGARRSSAAGLRGHQVLHPGDFVMVSPARRGTRWSWSRSPTSRAR